MTAAQARSLVHDLLAVALIVAVAGGTAAGLGLWLGFAASVAWRVFKWLNP